MPRRQNGIKMTNTCCNYCKHTKGHITGGAPTHNPSDTEVTPILSCLTCNGLC